MKTGLDLSAGRSPEYIKLDRHHGWIPFQSHRPRHRNLRHKHSLGASLCCCTPASFLHETSTTTTLANATGLRRKQRCSYVCFFLWEFCFSIRLNQARKRDTSATSARAKKCVSAKAEMKAPTVEEMLGMQGRWTCCNPNTACYKCDCFASVEDHGVCGLIYVVLILAVSTSHPQQACLAQRASARSSRDELPPRASARSSIVAKNGMIIVDACDCEARQVMTGSAVPLSLGLFEHETREMDVAVFTRKKLSRKPRCILHYEKFCGGAREHTGPVRERTNRCIVCPR
jgi:hypothetical protein